MNVYEPILEDLRSRLKKGRYLHTLGVMYTAGALAMAHGEELEKALLAGLLHDCGKYGSPEEQVQRCKAWGIPLTVQEEAIPALAHAKLGVYLARKRYGVEDEEVLGAIRWHTTGRPDMTRLEKILYLADYIEPHRRDIPGLAEIRPLAFVHLNRAVALTARNTLAYLKETGSPIDARTQETYQFYESWKEESEGCRMRKR